MSDEPHLFLRIHIIVSKNIRNHNMGKLIIDGNSFFEIDEECIKKKRISKKCGLDKYLNDKYEKPQKENKKKRGDG